MMRSTAAISRPAAGFTLLEVTIALVLTGVVVVAALTALRVSLVAGSMREVALDGTGLAEDLMGEILQQGYQDPGPSPAFGREGGEDASDRSMWDDVDDYRGLDNTPPRDRQGVALTRYEGWRRTVTVTKLDPVTLGPLADNASDAGARRVTVTVTSPRGRRTSLVAVRADVHELELPPMLDTVYVEHATIELQLAPGPPDPSRLTVGVLNHRRPTVTEASP